jgi:hypothetical protein
MDDFQMNQLADNETPDLEQPGSIGSAIAFALLFVAAIGSAGVNWLQWERIIALEEKVEERPVAMDFEALPPPVDKSLPAVDPFEGYSKPIPIRPRNQNRPQGLFPREGRGAL